MNDFNITDTTAFFRAGIMETLRQIPDPELNVNIVDLGLVYNVSAIEASKTISITMTLSSRHCPVGDTIVKSVENCMKRYYNEYTTEVNLVWEPEWHPDRITEEGLRQLGR